MVGARRWAAGAGLALAVTFGFSGAGGAQTVSDLDLGQAPKDLCRAVFAAGSFEGFLPKGEVAAGEPISVAVEWQPSNVAADKVDLLGCMSVDGQPADGLATLGRRIDNDGEHHLSFLLPDDVGLGAKVCERSAVIGPKADITRTPATCFAVASAKEAATPEARQSAAAAPAKPAPSEPKAAPAEAKAAPAEPKEVKPAAGPAPPVVAGATEERAPAAAPDALARTGSGSRPLGTLAGVTIILGGLAVAMGGPRVAAVRARRR
jgi:hypothetical protein